MKINTVLGLVAVVILGGVAYFTLSKTPAVDQQMIESPMVEDKAAGIELADGEEVMTEENIIVIEGTDFKFTPDTVTVKKGVKTKIIFKNIKGMHDFKVDELNIATAVINDGEEDFVEFTPTETGIYEFYCSVNSHRLMGMKGTLIIEE